MKRTCLRRKCLMMAPTRTRHNATWPTISKKTVRTLRKMRTGFLFITQSISKIRSDIFKQLHYCFYGAGLIANELKSMEEKDGVEAKEAYQKLPNPKQSGRYCFLVNGGLVCLGTSSRPMIIEATGDMHSFKERNQHLYL